MDAPVPVPVPKYTDGLPGCVKSESDLFNFDPESIHWLVDSINQSPAEYSGDPKQIATWVHTLIERGRTNPRAKNLQANQHGIKPRKRTFLGRIKALLSR